MPDDRIPWIRLDAADRERLRAVAAEVLPRFPWIQIAYFHGSAARGDRPARDLDIGLHAEPTPTGFAPEEDVARALAEHLGPWPFDVRLLDRSDSLFLHHVLEDGIVLFDRDPRARAIFEARAHALWLDFKPAWERTRRAVLQRWAHG